jgi:hypothetical protein
MMRLWSRGAQDESPPEVVREGYAEPAAKVQASAFSSNRVSARRMLSRSSFLRQRVLRRHVRYNAPLHGGDVARGLSRPSGQRELQHVFDVLQPPC